MKLLIVPVTPFQQNCSVLVDESTMRAVAIDPGGDLDRIDAALASSGATLEKVLLTHGHIDRDAIGLATKRVYKVGHHASEALNDVYPVVLGGRENAGEVGAPENGIARFAAKGFVAGQRRLEGVGLDSEHAEVVPAEPVGDGKRLYE